MLGVLCELIRLLKVYWWFLELLYGFLKCWMIAYSYYIACVYYKLWTIAY
jgi:hypothetical protein